MPPSLGEKFAILSDRLKTTPHNDPRTARACFALVIGQEYKEKMPNDSHEDALFLQHVDLAMAESELPPTIDACDVAHTMPGKRYPSFRETITATVLRYRELDIIKSIFSKYTNGGLYGGSLAYGPFFSVRDGTDASDVDIIFKLGDGNAQDVEPVWDSLIESSYIEEDDVSTFSARIPIFFTLAEKGRADVLSQRFRIARSGHNASVHFMTDTAIQHVFGETFSRNLGNKPHYETRIIRDYKATPFERGACINYDFSGRSHISPVTAEPAPGGFITSIPAYVVQEGRYCPGLYQSMALPTAQLINANPTFIGHQQQFGDTVKQRLEYEKTAFDSTAALVRANPRQAILPPDVSNIMHDIDTTL